MIRVAYLPGAAGRGPAIQIDRLVRATGHRVSWVPSGSVSQLKASLPDVDVVYLMDPRLATETQAMGTPTVCHIPTSVRESDLASLREVISTILVVTPSLKELSAASNVVLVENSVPDEFCPGPKDPKLTREVPVILFVGAICRSKGVDVLIQAVQGLACELWLVGAAHPAIQVRAKNIIHWGHQTDLVPFYRSADLFVLPSRGEGMSLALLEAMATGLPCIGSDIQANRDTLRGAGVLCGLTVAELRSAIRDLLDSKVRCSQLAGEALQVAKTRKFSDWCAMVVSILEATCSSS